MMLVGAAQRDGPGCGHTRRSRGGRSCMSQASDCNHGRPGAGPGL